jgi:hypothetical protein
MPFHVVIARSGEVLGRRDFDAARVRVGRDPENELRIDSPALSRRHAVFEQAGDAWTILDLASQNATLVNGKRIDGAHALNEGDEIQLGDFTVVFHAGPPHAASVPLIQDEAAYAVFGQTLQVHSRGEQELRERSAAVQAHLVDDSGRVLALDRDVVLFGRGEGCHVRTRGWFGPRVAAAVVRGHGGWSLVRLGRGRVVANGERVVERAWLVEGDAFRVGPLSFKFGLGLPPADQPAR